MHGAGCDGGSTPCRYTDQLGISLIEREQVILMDKNEIILYETGDHAVKLNVTTDRDTEHFRLFTFPVSIQLLSLIL